MKKQNACLNINYEFYNNQKVLWPCFFLKKNACLFNHKNDSTLFLIYHGPNIIFHNDFLSKNIFKNIKKLQVLMIVLVLNVLTIFLNKKQTINTTLVVFYHVSHEEC